MQDHIGQSYLARKRLFAKGLKAGRLTVQEIEAGLPAGVLTAAERWLLYYSLRAAQVEIVDEVTGQVDHGLIKDAPGDAPAVAAHALASRALAAEDPLEESDEQGEPAPESGSQAHGL